MTPGRTHTRKQAVARRSLAGAAASFRSTEHSSGAGRGQGWGTARGAHCDASAQRARCAGAFCGDLAVSGSVALFLFNEAAEQVGAGVGVGSPWAGIGQEAVRATGARAAQGAALNPSVRARFRESSE